MEVCPVTSLQNNKPDPVLSSQAGWRENLWVPSVVLCQLCWEAFRRAVGRKRGQLRLHVCSLGALDNHLGAVCLGRVTRARSHQHKESSKSALNPLLGYSSTP